ncbi:hypothetical protein FDW81_12925 [Pseudarthrobacter sp. NamB4]|nr:hypothetical protein FDW81_12925 [Pseudarthrobacter sp. NamB4]
MPSAEIEAMGAIEDAFVSLDDETRARVLGWAYAKYAAASDFTMGRSPQQRQQNEPEPASPVFVGELEATDPEVPIADRFQHFGELYSHCSPPGSQERFLVAAYWLQVKLAKETFGNGDINKLLRDQGEDIPGLNKVVDRMKAKSPKFVAQLGGGAADKTRRVLKLTQPGLKAVEEMVENAG